MKPEILVHLTLYKQYKLAHNTNFCLFQGHCIHGDIHVHVMGSAVRMEDKS